jgi:hypothetical protein
MAVIDRTLRVRPWLRRTAIVAFVLLLPIALHATWDRVEARRLARVVADLKARNEPVQIRETMAVSMGEQRNAARYYDAAAALVGHTDVFTNALRRELNSDSTETRNRAYVGLGTWLDANADAESLLTRATALDFLGYPAGTDYNYRSDRLIQLANLAGVRSHERIAAGDADSALRAVIRLVRLCRATEAIDAAGFVPGGFTDALLIRAAADAQAALPLRASDETLRDTQRAFREHDVDSLLEQMVVRNRARILGMFWDSAGGWYSRTPERVLFAAPWVLVRPFAAHRLVRHVLDLNAWEVIARRGWPDRLEVPAVPSPGKPPAPWSYQLLAYPARVNLSIMAERFRSAGLMLASIRTVDTALAVERYRLAHDGRPPAALTDLIPAFLPAVPIDPYSGRPVVYRASSRRYVVYCLGPDKTDDGGARVRWPRRPMSFFLSSTPPADVGIEGGL